MRVEIRGSHPPSRKKDPEAHARWKKEDPIWLLRQCLGNRLRSKHWRTSHHAKKKWLDAFNALARFSGEAVDPPALVVVHHALPMHPDIDAPIKVLLDAVQDKMFTNHDDDAASVLVVTREHARRGAVDPHVIVSATPLVCKGLDFLDPAHDALAEAWRRHNL